MWSKTGPHEWKHSCGWVIQRMWVTTGLKVNFFPCFRTVEAYHQGDNFDSAESIREAKAKFD